MVFDQFGDELPVVVLTFDVYLLIGFLEEDIRDVHCEVNFIAVLFHNLHDIRL